MWYFVFLSAATGILLKFLYYCRQGIRKSVLSVNGVPWDACSCGNTLVNSKTGAFVARRIF